MADSLQQLSPELVLILPPEVAAIARMTLPAPGSFASPAAVQPAARRFSLRRAGGLAAFYAAALTATVTPLYLALQALPSGR